MPVAEPAHDFVWLASQSPRRRQLLAQLGVRVELLTPDAAEDAESLEATRDGEPPRDYVQRVTLAKLEAARQRLARRGGPSAPILCADTTVALGRRILGKPADEADAARMLGALSGRTHQVLTAVAVAHAGGIEQRVQVSRVRFAPLDALIIQAYVSSGEPADKAGAYAIQGPLAGWITHIEGSHSGIMGLPLHETACLLREAGVRMAL
ncbi:MAG: Maf family protein [Rubrivivax sp.]